MTSPFGFDIEAEAVEASHLVKVACRRCGAPTLADPSQRGAARCAPCHLAETGAGVTADEARHMPYTKVVGDTLIRTLSAPEGSGVGGEGSDFPAPLWSSQEAGRWWDVGGDAPVVNSGSWPGPVELLANEAVRLEWRVRVQWAKGSMPHGTTGRPNAAKESWAVRGWIVAEGVRRNFCAVYRGASWDAVWMWGPGIGWFGYARRTHLSDYLAYPMRPAAWFDDVKTLALRKAEEAKRRAQERPKAAKKSEGM